jgi:hypothetical protein
LDPIAPPDPRAVDPVHGVSHWKINLGIPYFLPFPNKSLSLLEIAPQSLSVWKIYSRAVNFHRVATKANQVLTINPHEEEGNTNFSEHNHNPWDLLGDT